MRIICLNGWGGVLHDTLLPWIAAEAPDVFCLQEVVHTPATDKDWLTYRDGTHILPQRARFFQEVAAALPDHEATFCPAAQGVLWDEETAVPSQWGLATFVRRSYPIIGQAQGFVHKGYEPDGYGEHPRSRPAHGVRLYDHEAEHPVSILHMHGLRDLSGKEDTPARRKQAEALCAMAVSLAEPDDALVVCGDFNVLPGSETFAILGGLDLTELVTTRGFEGTRTSHYKKPQRFADYMLVNERAAPKAFTVLRDPEVSDHCPLVLDL